MTRGQRPAAGVARAATGTDALRSGAWDRLNGAHLYTSAAWLTAFAELGGMTPVSAVSGDGTAGAVGYDARTAGVNPRYTHAWLYEDALLAPVGSFAMLGGCSGYAGHLPHVAGAPAASRREALAAVVDEIRSPVTLLAHLTGEEAAQVVGAELLSGAPAPVLGMVTSELDLTGMREFDDYLGSLTRSSRSTVRADLRRTADAGVDVRVERLADVLEEVAPLLGSVQAHHGHDGSAAGAAGYLHLCLHGDLAAHAFAVVARTQGRAVAFALGYRWHDTVFMRVSGLDYDVAGRTAAYFATYFYTPVRLALEWGCVRVDLGGEALESKTRRGGALVPRWSLSTGASVDRARARAVTAARLADVRAVAGSAVTDGRVAAWQRLHQDLDGPARSTG
ncbi:GNAT family N-acetyltransferase [Cellulomonas sp. NPDC057328]|uniref:GNAT family N-acetyltransferase n=1 Tax=Cellulomonas sp. NPDC057328 TaxID=3346101 RepID=UPI00363E300A